MKVDMLVTAGGDWILMVGGDWWLMKVNMLVMAGEPGSSRGTLQTWCWHSSAWHADWIILQVTVPSGSPLTFYICVCVRGGGGGGCMLMFVCVHLCVSVIDRSVNSLSYVCSQQGDISLASPPPPPPKKKISSIIDLYSRRPLLYRCPDLCRMTNYNPMVIQVWVCFVLFLSPLPGILLWVCCVNNLCDCSVKNLCD